MIMEATRQSPVDQLVADGDDEEDTSDALTEGIMKKDKEIEEIQEGAERLLSHRHRAAPRLLLDAKASDLERNCAIRTIHR